jgi:site-specific recombinase XerD
VEAAGRARHRSGVSGVVAYHARGIFASRAHAAGADAATIAHLLGHQDISSLKVLIEHYLEVDEDLAREAVEKASAPRDKKGDEVD